MEAFLKGAERLEGSEVLHFENAEIEKTKGDQRIFSSVGPLSVLWFKGFNRYVLQLNDWRYPLLRRLPVHSSSPSETSGRTFTLQGLNGSTYRLTVNGGNTHGLSNLEHVFKNMSNYSVEGSEEHRKVETSPDDRVHRTIRKQSATVDFLNDVVKGVTDKVKVAKTYFTGKTKKRAMSTDIKLRDWKTEVKSRFPKDYFTSTDKLSKEFLNLRKSNPFNTEARQWEDFRKPSHFPTFYLPKWEIESAILNSKDIATEGNFTAEEPRKGIFGSLRSGFQGVSKTVTSGINTIGQRVDNLVHSTSTGISGTSTEGSESRSRTRPVDSSTTSTLDRATEGLTHSQG